MGAALARIVKHVPSAAVGGVITAVTVLAWGGLYQALPIAVCDISTATTPGQPCAPGELPDPSSRFEPSRPPPPPSDDGHGLGEPVPDCSSAYPNLRVCSQLPHWYMYGSEQEALAGLKRELSTSNLRIQTPSPSTSGPCPGVGQHYNVRDPKKPQGYPASIVCCPCCDDDDVGAPTEDRLCGIVYKNPGCDTRRRASDASCAE
jgi:hypothetical protein